MKFEVMSREKARCHSYKSDIEDCIIVSITDVGSEFNKFNENSHIKGIMNVKFDDVETEKEHGISEFHARTILDFVFTYKDIVDKIIVHCEAGVSRSAGVCAALMLIINGDDKEIFDNPKFCPNMFCYRTILDTHYGKYTDFFADEINKKEQHNLKIWEEANNID